MHTLTRNLPVGAGRWRWRWLVASALLQAIGATAATGLQISQVADLAPNLAVLLAGDAAVRPAAPGSSAAGGPVATAALGGTPLPVKSLARWEPSDGLAVVVALDVSASLDRAGFAVVKRQIADLVARLPPRSQVALMAIGADVRSVQDFSPVLARWDALAALEANAPETALYEGVLAAQRVAAQDSAGLPLRRAVLLVTDGLDDSKRGFGRDEVLRKIAAGDAPVYALALVSPRPVPAQVDAIRALAQIARTSGGALIESTAGRAGDGLSALLAQAQQVDLLTVDCARCPRDGGTHTLQVSLRLGGNTVTDARELRLLAPRGPTPPPTAPPPPPAPDLLHWQWGLGLVLLLAAGAVAASLHRRRNRPAPGTPVSDQGEDDDARSVEKVSRAAGPESGAGLRLTLDVAGRGRMDLRVTGGDKVLGRAATADVSVTNDPEASGRHAALYLDRGVLMLRDLGSSNGTFLNGVCIVRPEPVQDRDLIVVGRTEVRVYLGQP